MKDEFIVTDRATLIDAMMKTISESLTISNVKMFPLNSLYLYDHKRSFRVGDQIVLEGDIIVTKTKEVPTHEIINLEGTLSDNKHRITVRNLSTNEVKSIDL